MLSILEYTSQIWHPQSFEKIAIIAAQHVMESTFLMFKNLKNNGLNPKQTFILGKCYSTSRSIIEEFKEEGFEISEMSTAYDSHQPFDIYYKLQIMAFAEQAIAHIEKDNIHKIIVVDDGGYLLHYLSNHPIIHIIPIVGVEQTSSGFNFLNQSKIQFPILNVARSKAKLILETPFIIRSCFERLYKYISIEELASKTILILGNGVIGKCAAEFLSEQSKVIIYDPKTMSQERLFYLLPQADLILGCSGNTSIIYEYYKYLKFGTTLVSFSSSDREFDAYSFRRLFPQSSNCHENYSYNGVTLIQSGFPINFWGDRMNMPMEHIQVTLALLTAAIYQAISIVPSSHFVRDPLNTQICDNTLRPLDEESELLIMQEAERILYSSMSYENRL